MNNKAHDMVIRCITDSAIIGMVASGFLVDYFPNKAIALSTVCGLWLIIFGISNGLFRMTRDPFSEIYEEEEE